LQVSFDRFFTYFLDYRLHAILLLFALCSQGARAQTPTALPTWDVGFGFAGIINSNAHGPARTCSVAAGALPPGLTFAVVSTTVYGVTQLFCEVYGTPTQAGTFFFTLFVLDDGNGQADFSMIINPSLSITTASTLRSGSINSAYNLTLTAGGGTAPYGWSISSGSLPAGLNLNNAGVLSGTPTQSGTFSFTIQLSDALANFPPSVYYGYYPPGTVSEGVISKSFSLSIGAQSQTPAALPTWDVGSGFYVSFSTGSSTPSATSCTSAGNLPPGLAYGLVGSSGNGYCELKGTPTMAGTYTFTISVVDGSGPSSGPFTMTINPARTITVPSPLPNGVMNSAYSSILFVGTGGTPPFTATYSGSLPAGMTFDNGLLSGTPAQSGTFNFTVLVADALSSAPDTGYYPPGATTEGTVSKAFQLTISGGTPVPTITSITNAAGEGSAIAENTWIEIKGLNLSTQTRLWQTADFVNNQLPTQLSGVGVTVNGKNAYIYYISPTQVNVLTPVDSTQGSVQVQLTNNGAVSAPFAMQLQSYAPGFFEFNGGPYAAATHSNGSLAGPASLFPGASTPVTPGEILTLYAGGFGQTSPPLTSGSVTQTGTLPALPQIKIGGIAATVQFAGVVSPGLYQLNVYVPASAPAGDNTVVATYDGASSNTALISVGAPSSTGTLQIQITGLPTGTTGNLSVTSNSGFSATVTANETLQVPVGIYTIAANLVPLGNVSYGAFPSQQSLTVSGGSVNPVTISYSIIILNTTQVLDQQGSQGLSVSADGSTLTLPMSSQTAKSLSPGTVLAIGSTPAAPNGLLRKVVSVSQSGSQVVAQTTQATFVEAFQQANFTFTTTLNPQNTPQLKASRAGVNVRWKSKEGSAPIPQDTSPSACNGTSSLLVQMFDSPVLSDQNGAVTVSGEIEVCPSLTFNPNITAFPPKLNSLVATTTLGESVHVNVIGSYHGSFTKSVPVATVASEPITVFVGPVPIILTPSVTFFVGISGSAEAGFSVGVTQNASVTGGFSYMNGQTSPVTPNPVTTFAADPIGLDANLSAKAFAGATLDLTVEGVLSLEFSPDAYLQMNVDVATNPWWTLSGGLEGDAIVKVGVFGVDLPDFDLPTLFDFSKVIAQASGGFIGADSVPVLMTVAPNTATAGASGMNLTLSGSNFVPGATAKFGGAALSSTFVNPGQLTASVPASLLIVAGTFPVTVTNPDQAGATSAPVNFTVQPPAGQNPAPAITSLSPSSAIAGTSSLTVTINGTGFLASSTVKFNGAIHSATFVNASQLSLSLGSSDLSTPGTLSIIVTNPTPGGGSSQPAMFTVQQAAATVTLQSLTLSSTTVIGGAPVTGTVTLSGPAQSGGVQVALSSSNSIAQVPASVTVPSGQANATFTIATTSGNATQTVIITATLSNTSKTAALSVTSIPITNVFLGHDLELDGTTLLDGQTTPFHITLSLISGYSAQFDNISNSGSSSITVSVGFSSSFSTEAISGNTVTFTGIDPSDSAYSNIAQGIIFPQSPTSGSLSVTVNSSAVGSPFTGSISFTAGGVLHQANLMGTVSSCNGCTLPTGSPSLQSFALSSNTVNSGFFLNLSVTLTGPNPNGDTLVYLASNNASVPLPANVLLVPYGQTSASLLITAPQVTSTQTAVLMAGLGTTLQSANVTVSPTSLTNIWTHTITAQGTVMIDSTSVQLQCLAGVTISYAYCTTVLNSSALQPIFLVAAFDQLASVSGQTVTFGVVDAESIFAPNANGAGAQPVTAGTLSLTGASSSTGSTITGILSFTVAGVSRQIPLLLTVTQVQ
jgi:uncharacterized protein (TIGR03437 family)